MMKKRKKKKKKKMHIKYVTLYLLFFADINHLMVYTNKEGLAYQLDLLKYYYSLNNLLIHF